MHAGEVTLEGTVMSADDRRLAAELVAQKPGEVRLQFAHDTGP